MKTRSTLRLGFIAAVLYMILFISGMYLMFFYRPVAPDAYYNMHELSTTVAFGQFVRNIHRWSAHLMVLVVCLHMLRVFYSGAYKAPRQFNWVVGVGLLVFTLLMSFTGYLLPWDQLSYWAITVGTNIAGYVPIFGNQARNVLLGGPSVGNDTLLRFYVLHIYFLPALIFVVLGIHIWRVRKDGFAVAEPQGAERPSPRPDSTHRGDHRCPSPEEEPRYRFLGVVEREIEQRDEQEPDDTVWTWPHFLIRHVVVAAGTILVVFALAIAFNAPLQDLANPSLTPDRGQGALVLRRPAGAALSSAAHGGGRVDPGRRAAVPAGAPLHRPEPGLAHPRPEDGRDRLQRTRPVRARPHPHRRPLPRAGVDVGVALAAPLPGAIAMDG